jgi:DNA polymerase-3 subunit delta'
MTATWAALIGQDRAAHSLRRAAAQPGHAYLIAGPRGAGTADAARAFAAALVASDGDERTTSLVARRVHPDVIEYEPERMVITIDQAREEIIPEAWRSPIESDRKVLLLLEAERLQPEAANALLKTFEEPPERTVMVLVSEAADELLDTVRSRCQRIDLGALDDDTIEQALVEAGVHASDAALAARLSGGQLGRARDLVGDSRALRDTFVDAASHVDGTGASAAHAAERMLGAVHEAIAAVKARHAEELAEFDAEAARVGYEPRDLRRLRRRIEERHPARERLARRKAISEGIAALETLYRDALAGPDAALRNVDRQPLVIDARAGVRALDACRHARDALEFNPNESLLLERLALHLPGSEPTPPGYTHLPRRDSSAGRAAHS